MKAALLRRTLTGVTGEQLVITLGLFSKEFAVQVSAESAEKVKMLAQSTVLLPTGERIPFKVALRELGIKGIGQDLLELDMRESDLIVPEPRIMLASR